MHRPADPETVGWNRAREAEFLAERDAALGAEDAAMTALAATLRDLAPAVFGNEPVPLAVGIHRDIAARLAGEADMATIGRFLRQWTRRANYLRAIAAGTMRRDLDGNPTSEPTAAQREAAVRWLAAQRREAAR